MAKVGKALAKLAFRLLAAGGVFLVGLFLVLFWGAPLFLLYAVEFTPKQWLAAGAGGITYLILTIVGRVRFRMQQEILLQFCLDFPVPFLFPKSNT